MGETWAHDEFGGLILTLLAEGIGETASRLRCLSRTIWEQCESTVGFEVSQNGSMVMTFFLAQSSLAMARTVSPEGQGSCEIRLAVRCVEITSR